MPRAVKPLSPPSAPTARGENTRQALIKAAHTLFLKHGFHGTSMRQIARKAGLAVGASYNHFVTKEALFAAVLDAHHPYHIIFPALENVTAETLEEFVRIVADKIRLSIEQAEAETQLLPLMLMELVEFRGQHLAQLAETILPLVMAFLQRVTLAPHELRPLPAPIILRSLASLLVGYLLTGLVLKRSAALQAHDLDWFGGMMDIYLHGIVRPPAEA
jgi:AcrR family transcriptional regulator